MAFDFGGHEDLSIYDKECRKSGRAGRGSYRAILIRKPKALMCDANDRLIGFTSRVF